MEYATLTTFTSPVILFFLLGLVAAGLRSELAIPEAGFPAYGHPWEMRPLQLAREKIR